MRLYIRYFDSWDFDVVLLRSQRSGSVLLEVMNVQPVTYKLADSTVESAYILLKTACLQCVIFWGYSWWFWRQRWHSALLAARHAQHAGCDCAECMVYVHFEEIPRHGGGTSEFGCIGLLVFFYLSLSRMLVGPRHSSSCSGWVLQAPPNQHSWFDRQPYGLTPSLIPSLTPGQSKSWDWRNSVGVRREIGGNSCVWTGVLAAGCAPRTLMYRSVVGLWLQYVCVSGIMTI